MGAAGFISRLYLQYLVIIAIALFFAYVLDFVFATDDNELRIMLSGLFLLGFAGSLLAIRKI
jgi:hypothetical protein